DLRGGLGLRGPRIDRLAPALLRGLLCLDQRLALVEARRAAEPEVVELHRGVVVGEVRATVDRGGVGLVPVPRAAPNHALLVASARLLAVAGSPGIGAAALVTAGFVAARVPVVDPLPGVAGH